MTWDAIERIVFVAKDFISADEIYLFTSERAESCVIPTEADGGSELWYEILRRDLFDAELAIEAASSGGGTFIWPPVGDGVS